MPGHGLLFHGGLGELEAHGPGAMENIIDNLAASRPPVDPNLVSSDTFEVVDLSHQNTNEIILSSASLPPLGIRRRLTNVAIGNPHTMWPQQLIPHPLQADTSHTI